MRPRFFTTPAKWREWLELHHRPPASCGSASTSAAPAGPASPGPSRWTRRSVSAGSTGSGRASTRPATSSASRPGGRQRLEQRQPGARAGAHAARPDAAGGAGRPRGAQPARSGLYSYEQRKSATLPEALKRRLKRNRKAWAFFQEQPAWYRQGAVWWIVSAKKPETRERRLTTLIEDSAAGRTIKPLTRPARRRAAPPATPDRRPRRPPPRRPRT